MEIGKFKRRRLPFPTVAGVVLLLLTNYKKADAELATRSLRNRFQRALFNPQALSEFFWF